MTPPDATPPTQSTPEPPVAAEAALPLTLFNGDFRFAAGAQTLEQLPPFDLALPEFAFVGRSNVGKSSLLNALTHRKQLARTSNTPGRTQQLNFFTLAGFFTLVDLPGYGYNQAGKGKAKLWTRLTQDYLKGRPTLARAFLLVDARHGLKPNDTEFAKLLDTSAVSYQFVLTKADKVPGEERAERLSALTAAARQHPAAYPEVLLTSSETGEGIDDLRAAILRRMFEMRG
jgi:GTP-binding protein